MKDIRTKISDLLKQVIPFDQVEKAHIVDALAWIKSGVEIFRIEKPETPPKHLVSFCVLVDKQEKKILLLEHKNARLLLPSGGHIDKNELPLAAAKRELSEELGVNAEAIFCESGEPFFVTVTETVGNISKHIDVSMWYVFGGDSKNFINSEAEEFKREFNGYYWLGFDKILARPVGEFDKNMHRFVLKLKEQYG